MKKNHFVAWLILIIVITGMSFLVYGSAQQILRQSANDPQIQISEDLASALSKGTEPAELNSDVKVDIATSLATFVITYDANGTALASTAALNDDIPVPPIGVLQAAKAMGQNRVTWQPQKGVRIALVVTPYSYTDEMGNVETGFVAVGRSIREIESREGSLLNTAACVWALCVILISVLFFVSRKRA